MNFEQLAPQAKTIQALCPIVKRTGTDKIQRNRKGLLVTNRERMH